MLKVFRPKKIYFYALAIIVFFIMIWGAVDTVSAGLGLVLVEPAGIEANLQEEVMINPAEGEVSIEALYQKRMFLERIADSLARLIVGGAAFAFLNFKINQEEKGESA